MTTSGHKEEESGGRRAEDGAWKRIFPSSGRREKHPRRMLSQMRGAELAQTPFDDDIFWKRF